MVVVPLADPVTTPVVELTVALALLADHVPPDGVAAKVTADPVHTFSTPDTDDGSAFTVIEAVLKQPVGIV